MPTIEENLRRAQAELDRAKTLRQIHRKRNNEETVKNLFWALVLVAILFVGIFMIYQNRDSILGAIQTRTGINPLAVLTPAAQTAPTVSAPSANCEVITVQTTEGSQLKITPTPKVGQCYSIDESSLEGWNKVIGSVNELSRFSQFIYDKSADQSLDVNTIQERLKDSTSSGTLDLRSTQAQSSLPPAEEPIATVEATQEPDPTQTEILPTPTLEATSTPAVVVVPWPEKERGFDLSELALVMTEHNIQTVSGTNNGKTPQDKVRWALYYTVEGDTQDYLVFSILNSPLPQQCRDGNSLTISLVGTGDQAEKWLTAGDHKIAFTCQ